MYRRRLTGCTRLRTNWQLEEVNLVTIATGSINIFFSVTLRSASEMLEFLNTKVWPIPGVRRTEGFVNLATKKRDFGVVV